ncbi:diguanylate cyclase [Telmatospirillum siberiense]|uniref:Diguanylate cyclase n=2 Tax=Telmatospirillum siberiense TaxID=382514 RepID=A0A2N3PU19_9PROT|nr:diguanylate cyclase [Telmatospirillum siberiense]
MRRHILIINGILLLIVLPVVSWSARRLAHPVDLLAVDAERIRGWDFSGITPTGSVILEIDSLARAFVQMKQSLIERTRKLEKTQESLKKLVDLAIALSAEKDSNRLMEMILSGAKDLARADGGTVYIRDDDECMAFRIMKNDSLGIDYGADSRSPGFPHVPLFDRDGSENHRNVVSLSVHLRKSTNIADAYDAADQEFSGTRQFDRDHGYRTMSLLTVPLMPRGGEPLGALQLINAIDPATGEITAFSPEIERFVQALSALAATALYNRTLLDSQRNLVNSLIRILAGAIDAKSPYTGAHCERVPELAFMLAKEACETTSGPLAHFRFDTEEQWDEFRIGAWLHDCGKVTTPEYVIDKATKLETIHNRIHEIRTRFEVLWRDAEITALQTRLDGGDAEATARRLEERRQSLVDDFAFVAACNIGGEFMDPQKIERLKAVARQPWIRHFDDRLGLSHGELSRLASTPPLPVPAGETLLSDKPEHIFARMGSEGTFDARFGFKMAVPEHLYNLGEIYNLSISRGTLTPEERFKINEHIVHTIIMLDSLEFPKHLKRVPEYAGTHHETLIGTGYPRQLTGEQLSIPARVMVIADIFEALTASDRPYKKPKTLSEAVEILSQFAQRKHIDQDLFRLFLESGIHRRYAEKFLSAEQNDTVDIERYLNAC